MGKLRITNGPHAGETIEVIGEVVIGRENADLTIDDSEVSRRHAAVRQLVGAVEVEDLGSSNGTFVDGDRIDGPTRVGGGAEIRLGETVLAVEGVLPVDATRARDVPDLDLTGIADLQATRAKEVPVDLAQATRTSDGRGDLTRARRVPGTGNVASPESKAPAAPVDVPNAAPTSASQTASPALPVGAFSPPVRRRKRGLASRSWVPAVLSFGTVVLVAVALVIYFATR